MQSNPLNELRPRLRAALNRATDELLAARASGGHWVGELSSSALSTATAVTALAVVEREAQSSKLKTQISAGLEWLAAHANADGGWGDTVLSLSNLSTTALCWAAFGAVPGADEKFFTTVHGAERWLARHVEARDRPHLTPPSRSGEGEAIGRVETDALARAVIARYGKDRTFSVPILTMCALAGRLGAGREAWKHVIPLPFELAACPHSWFAALRLPVVSYALPALIAIGQARHHHAPSSNPLARAVRNLTRDRTLRVLTEIQPPNGGFLEATPLTSFVTMSLAGSGHAGHIVTRRGAEFLLKSQRPDGSWPIDTNLATWLTTLAVDALEHPPSSIIHPQSSIRSWLLAQQYRVEHPYTHAAPGGWAWTDLPGGVPDADDTAGALLALRNLLPTYSSRGHGRDDSDDRSLAGPAFEESADPLERRSPTRLVSMEAQDRAWSETGAPGSSSAHLASEYEVSLTLAATGCEQTLHAAFAGIRWLLDVQNRDGGIPTFCRGWGALPFDRSSADITAHAIRSWLAWLPELSEALRDRVLRALQRALDFLVRCQGADGSWAPLWFGNQFAPGEENPTYGTARVLCALAEVGQRVPPVREGASPSSGSEASVSLPPYRTGETPALRCLEQGIRWLVRAQNVDGGWGGAAGVASSVEETALAVEALAASQSFNPPIATAALSRGVEWLVAGVESGAWTQPSPIGFYFAKLWYYEKLYPLIFTVGALNRVAALINAGPK